MRRVIIISNIAGFVVFTVLAWRGYFLLGAAASFSVFILWLAATLVPQCAWFGEVVAHFPTARREVWLTIDDGPDAQETCALLDLLEKHHARATFFVIGDKVDELPSAIMEICRRGSEIGNHTQHHAAGAFWAFGPLRTRLEVSQCNEAILRAGGAPPVWFRAPAGLRNHWLHPVLSRHGMRLLGWSARGFDGIKCDPAVAFDRIKRKVRPGAIIVIHEGRGTAVELLGKLLVWLEAEGYRCVLPYRNAVSADMQA